MKVRRERYLSRLIARKHDGFVKIVTGIRRCGKSFLLFNLFREHLISEGVDSSHIIGVDLESKENVHLRNPNKLFDFIVSLLPDDGKWTYVFIDEVQMCRKVLQPGVKLRDVAPEDRQDAYITFYDILNSLRKKPNVDVYVTGSNSKLLSKDVATNFRDRGVEIRLHPFSFAEYLQATGYADKSEALSAYMIWGGMPVAVMEADDVARAEYLKSLFSKVYIKDIIERNHLRTDAICESVLDVVSSSAGSLTNPNKLANTINSRGVLKTAEPTVKSYLDYFVDSFLFAKAARYEVRGRKYLLYPSKYYAEDVGLRNARLNFREIEPTYLMENIIYNELVLRGYNVDVGVVDVNRRDDEGKMVSCRYEIDFIVNAGFNKVYIQSAYDMSRPGKAEQETKSLKLTADFFQKIVVENGYGQLRPDEDGILHVGVIPFLLDTSILDGIIKEAKSSQRRMIEA